MCRKSLSNSRQVWSKYKESMSRRGRLQFMCFLFLVTIANASWATEIFKISEVVPDTMPGDLELVITPTPQEAKYWPEMLKIDGEVAIITPQIDKLRAGKEQVISSFGGEENVKIYPELKGVFPEETLILIGNFQDTAVRNYFKELKLSSRKIEEVSSKKEGYILIVDYLPAEQKTLILVCGSTFQAQFWGIQSLKQITYQNLKGEIFARRVQIFDWPTFELRGCKRAQVWEHAFKSNFRYSILGGGDKEQFENHFMEEWITDPLLASGELDCSEENIERFELVIKNSSERGVSGFCFHVDDQPMKMAKETDEKFKGNYEAAICYILNRLYKTAKQYNPKAKVFFLPQPYWTSTDYGKYASEIKKAGGLPDDIGLMLCGPEVTSPAIPWDDVKRYKEAFGLTKTKALIYDNYLRSTCFAAIDKRPAKLHEEVSGISPETGSATSRITRLDWSWNPEAYDEKRSLMLACREIGGLEAWPVLYRAVSLIEGRFPLAYSSQEEAVSSWKKNTTELEGLLVKLKKMKEEGKIQGRVNLPEERFSLLNVKGTIDDLGLFSRALTEKEIEKIQNIGLQKSLAEGIISKEDAVGIWLFDEDGKIKDFLGRQKDGTIKGSIEWVMGKFGKGVFLSGKTIIEIPYNETLSLQRFTITGWAKMKDTVDYQSLIHKYAPNSNRSYSLIISKDTGAPYVDVSPVAGVDGKTKVTDEKWHFLAATYDGEKIRVFVDGRLDGERAVKAELPAGEFPVTIGGINSTAETLPQGFAYDIVTHLTTAAESTAKEDATEEILKNTFKFAQAVKISQPPEIDGKLTEKVWSEVPSFADFCTAGSGQAAPSEKQSLLKFCYDENNLYIGIKNDSSGFPSLETLNHEGSIMDDGLVHSKVRILLDPGRTRRNSYEFTLDRYGNMRDAYFNIESDLVPQGKAYTSSCKKAVSEFPGGWTVELSIPFSFLGLNPSKGDIWGLNVWTWKHGSDPSIWSNKIWWWGFLDVKQAGNLKFE